MAKPTRMITIRVSPDEFNKIIDLAASSGYSMNQYGKSMMLSTPLQSRYA